MRHSRRSLFAAIVVASLAWLAVSSSHAQAPRVTIYEGARLLTGDGVVIEDSAFIVANDRFVGPARCGSTSPARR
jgi:hypothetical protein